MIGEGERVLLGVSGGKDSLAMAYALSVRRRWIPVPYEIEALLIDWEDFPLSATARDALSRFFDDIEVPLSFARASIPKREGGEFSCYCCARMRKRILFERAGERGSRRVALGHHMDDIVETALINLAFNGRIETMSPVKDFFGGAVSVIRPLCEVRESTIARVAARLEFPIVQPSCPLRGKDLRARVKPIVRQLSHLHGSAREHIYQALLGESDDPKTPERAERLREN
jgi:tRNA 2-thiocytidine biosynthesis protein TtcA